jgi:glycosyltransferase involved in cell wall biosynthesis
MIPWIIVLNRNYLPESKDGPHPCGASFYAIQLSEILKRHQMFGGFVLYNRKDDDCVPRCSELDVFGSPAIQMDFSFKSDAPTLKNGLADAVSLLLGSQPSNQSHRGLHRSRAVLYFQTDVLLPFCPDHATPVVTHHGPFADLLVQTVGLDLAAKSFGTHQKLEHLQKYQRASLKWLGAARHVKALEISRVQETFLVSNGVPSAHISRLPPPLYSEDEPANGQRSRSIHLHRVGKFIESSSSSPILMTAVSRLDEFKNVELLLGSAARLIEAQADILLLVIGGSNDDKARERLASMIPEQNRARTLFLPKLRHQDLIECFSMLRRRGVFVCTSRFETCGFTPLEAAAHGVMTLVPDLPEHVEASAHFPKKFRFDPTVMGLTSMLHRVLPNPSMVRDAEDLCMHVRDRVSVRAFERTILTLSDLIVGRRGQTEEEGAAKRVFRGVLRRREDVVGE